MGAIKKNAASKTVYNDPSVYTPKRSGSSSSSVSSSSSGSSGPGAVLSYNSPSQSPSQSSSSSVTVGQSPSSAASSGSSWSNPSFSTSRRTNHYARDLYDIESSKPYAYSSAYESQINDILNTIYNKGSFDINTDTNYQTLYDTYKQNYETQANKAMRDKMASANAATGGYGSTYSQVAGQQAYDDTMQGLNDNQSALMNLAYQIYSDDRANDYNKLSAFQTQDNTNYSRYRDDVSDWQTDRAYYANQYQQSYSNDRSAYDTNRSFSRSTYENDRDYNYQTSQDAKNAEYTQYQNALSEAIQLVSNGLSVPQSLTDIIDQYNSEYGYGSGTSSASSLATLAAQAQTAAAAKNASSRDSGLSLESLIGASSEGTVTPNSSINTGLTNYYKTRDSSSGDYASEIEGNSAFSASMRQTVNSIGEQLAKCATNVQKVSVVNSAYQSGKINGSVADSILKNEGIDPDKSEDLNTYLNMTSSQTSSLLTPQASVLESIARKKLIS